MPRTKKQPPAPPENGTAAAAEVFTLADAAAYLRVEPEAILPLVREQGLPARQIGQEWRFLKSSLQEWLRTGPAKKSILDYAGAIRDDPHAEEMLKEIYRLRGRPETEEG